MGINETLATFFKNLSGNHAVPKAKQRRISNSKVPTVTYAVSSEPNKSKKNSSSLLMTSNKTAKKSVNRKKAKKAKKIRLQLDKALVKNFVNVACNSTNALGAFLYGSDATTIGKHKKASSTGKKYHDKRVDTAFIPSQTAGKYVVKVNPNNRDGTISAPYDSVASEAAAAAVSSEADKENVGYGANDATCGPAAKLGDTSAKAEHQRRLIGWLQMIHVDKRIVRQKSALLKDLFSHIEKNLGHLFSGGRDEQSPLTRTKQPLTIVCGFVKNGHLVDARAYERTGPKAFRKVSLQFMSGTTAGKEIHTQLVRAKSPVPIEEIPATSAGVSDLDGFAALQELAHDLEVDEATEDLPAVEANKALSASMDLNLNELENGEIFDPIITPTEPIHGQEESQTHTAPDHGVDELLDACEGALEEALEASMALSAPVVTSQVETDAPKAKKPRRRHYETRAAREWFLGVCTAGQVPDNVTRGAIALFRRTYPLQRANNPTALLMGGFEVPVSTEAEASRRRQSGADRKKKEPPLLTCSQHQIACLRLAYKFIDDLYPQLTAFADVADPLPVGHNPKNWWRLAETAIMVEMNWDLHNFFRQTEVPSSTSGNEWWE